MPRNYHAQLNCPTEWSFTAGKAHNDPFNDIELDVIVTDSDGRECRVPAFWAGGQEWRVRFAPRSVGEHTWCTACTDADSDLHGIEGTLHAAEYDGDNPLLRHGPIRIAADKRHFEHADGTPFFWLGDTWWMALTTRLGWPDDFQRLTADRVQKGFSVIQLVAGLYPDMPPFDPRGANEAGQSWEDDWARINPAFYDLADLKIQWLVKQGLVPCIVGCWGYYLPILGAQRMKKHWRNLVARYGAYPVVWCLAGEGSMPWYLSKNKETDKEAQEKGWAEIGAYVQEIDPVGHLVTIHPSSAARETVSDDSVLDFDMLQTGHGGRADISNTMTVLSRELAREPIMPVLNGEVCYEGILEKSREEVQRLMFWSNMLSGAAGHTYGANGIWQLNLPGKPYGPSPWGGAWGNRPWPEAAALPGSKQVGIGRAILENYDWWRFEPHQEWIEPAGSEENYDSNYAAGIPGELRVIYLAHPIFPWSGVPAVKNIEPNVKYRAVFVSVKTGERTVIGQVDPDADGNWNVPLAPELSDYVLILDREKADVSPPGAIMYA